MTRFLLVSATLLLLAGCGLGETAASVPGEAIAKAEELKQAKAAQAKIEQQLEDAGRVAEEQRKAGEAASQ